MTTGSTTRDFTVTKFLDCGPAKCGYYYQKTWDGTDYPAVPNRARNDRDQTLPSDTAAEDLQDESGDELYSRRNNAKFYVKFNRPPKRVLVEDHSYSATWKEYLDPEMDWYHTSLGYKRGSVHSCFGLPVHADPWVASDDLLLLGKLREAVAGSEFNAGVFLGESKEALDMIANNAVKLAKSLKYLRKGNFTQAAHSLGLNVFKPSRSTRTYKGGAKAFPITGSGVKPSSIGDIEVHRELSARWLELQYGWLPLLSDCKAGAEFLAHHLNSPLVKRVVVRRNAGGRRPQDMRDTFLPNYTYHPEHSKTISRSQIIAYISEVNVPQLSGLTDPASVAWELVPFSFVADWFIPIGSWLSARGLSQALTGKFVTTHTYRYECSNHLRRRILGVYEIHSPSYFYKQGSISRTVSTTLAIPKIEVKPLSKALSWAHCENAVALLIQLGSKSAGGS